MSDLIDDSTLTMRVPSAVGIANIVDKAEMKSSLLARRAQHKLPLYLWREISRHTQLWLHVQPHDEEQSINYQKR